MATQKNQDHEVKEPTPIRTDLFRFTTLRTPQLISEERKKWGYIFHPEAPRGDFQNEIIRAGDLETARDAVQAVAKRFSRFLSIEDIKRKYPELYNFSNWLLRNGNLITEIEATNRVNSLTAISAEDLVIIWDNLFYELVKRENPINRQAFIQIIIASNFISIVNTPSIKTIAESLILTPKNPLPPEVEKRYTLFLRRVANAVIVVPKAFTIAKKDAVSNNNDNDNYATSSSKIFGMNKLGIAVLRKVEQELCCYVPGEVSRIENVMAREYKERHTRQFQSSETTTETISETEMETQTDTVSTTRNEMQQEISKVLTTDNSIETGASLGVTAEIKAGGSLFGLIKVDGGGSVDMDGYFDYSTSNSSSVSDTSSQTFAQEVTTTASERILQKTSEKRTSKMLQEYEENNRHGFDNRKGDQHVTGVYRWIDTIYTNRLINYGKRLMFEFVIPEPARFYKKILQNKITASILPGEEVVKPNSPSFYGINSAEDIVGYKTDEINDGAYAYDASKYYQTIGAVYGIELSAPPSQVIRVEQTYFQSGLDENGKFGGSGVIAIPTGYRCKKFACLAIFQWEPDALHDTDWYIQIGGRKVLRVEKASGSGGDQFNDYKIEEGQEGKDNEGKGYFDNYINTSVGVSFCGDNTYSYNISIVLKCEIIPEEYAKWQNDTYRKIMDAYNSLLTDYENAAAAAEKKLNMEYNRRSGDNKKFNRTVEQRELKRTAIEMLLNPFGLAMGKDFYYDTTLNCGKDNASEFPHVLQTKALNKYSQRVKFFEQVFDWHQMTYHFFPYYWADPCKWEDLYQIDPKGDQIFEAFLQSGMARVLIPVTKGFERALNYYLETGDIWTAGGLIMDMDDDIYISVEEELREIEGVVVDEWETRIPTTLTIIQGKSVYLDDESLPCCNNLEESTDTLLKESEALLGNV